MKKFLTWLVAGYLVLLGYSVSFAINQSPLPGSLYTWMGPSFTPDWVFYNLNPPLNNFAALRAAVGGFQPTVTILGYYNPGDSGGPISYQWTATPCSRNAGAGDNGAQVAPLGGGGCWLQNVPPGVGYDVRTFGADPTGVTDSSTAISNADIAGSQDHHSVYFSTGTYKDGTCIIPAFGSTWTGDGRNSSILSTNSAVNCQLNLTNAAFTIRDMQLTSSVTRTAGNPSIIIAASDENLVRVNILNPSDGIYFNSGSISEKIDSSEIFGNTGNGVVVNSCLNCFMNNFWVIAATGGTSGIKFVNSGDFSCHNCALLSAATNVLFAPGAGQTVSSVKFSGGYLDSPTGALPTNLDIKPSSTGAVYRTNFDGVWFGSGTANNIIIEPGVSAAADGITFSNCEAYLSTSGSGFAVISPAANIVWTNGKIAQNNIGVFISGATHVTIADAVIGASAGFTGNTTAGISIGNNGGVVADYIDVHDIQQIPQNGSPFLAYTATGTRNRIRDLPGYTPTGIIGITVTASPFTYTNSIFNETVYGYGNAITSVTENTVAIINAVANGGWWTVNLGPNESIVVTYPGSAPTMQGVPH